MAGTSLHWMTGAEVSRVLLTLSVLIGAGQILGEALARLRQPRVIGEVLAGVVLGPCVLGRWQPQWWQALFGEPAALGNSISGALSFISWVGLLLLMFVSGAEIKGVLDRQNQKTMAWILGVGAPLPFVLTVLLAPLLPIWRLAGPGASEGAVVVVLATSVAVTSVPVISRIFQDLGIMESRLATMVLGVAMLEDVVLWGAIGVASALNATAGAPVGWSNLMINNVGVTIAYFAIGLLLMPGLIRRLHGARYNLIQQISPVGYPLFVLVAYVASATSLGVNAPLAALLAGIGFADLGSGQPVQERKERLQERKEREERDGALAALKRISFAVCVPTYFVLVGAQLRLDQSFSLSLLLAFLLGSSLLHLSGVGLASRLAGFRGLDVVNLAVASNARGGPGILVASVALDGGIINGEFFTALVLVALLTSQFAGAWFAFVIRNGWTLLSEPAAPAPAYAGQPSVAPRSAATRSSGSLGR